MQKARKGKLRKHQGLAGDLVQLCVCGLHMAIAVVVVDGVHIKIGRERFEQLHIWNALVADTQDEVIGIEGAEYGRVPPVVGRDNLNLLSFENPLPHGDGVPFWRACPGNAVEARIRGAPCVVESAYAPLVVRSKVCDKGPASRLVLGKAQVEYKDFPRIPRRFIIQEVPDKILLPKKGLHFMPETVREPAVPE